MKVAYFALGEIYGSQHAGFTHTYNIVKALSKITEIKLFIGGEEKKTDVKTVFVDLPSTKLGTKPGKYPRSYLKVRRESKKVDVIHERFHVNPIDLLFVKGKKYVLEVNDPAPVLYSGFKGEIYSKIIKMKFRRADAIITQTGTMKKILSKFFRKKIFVVPNGVDMNFFEKNTHKVDIRKRYGIKIGTVIITFLGAFREWHGVHDIPKMAREIKKKKKDAVFLLVGSGPLSGKLEREKIKNVILAGPRPYSEIPSILSQSDILIAPFNTQRFRSLEKFGFYWCPMKLFEYMASGKPIVSYGFPEIEKITRGSALLAEPGNLTQFISMVAKLVEDSETRERLGGKGKRVAERDFDWSLRAKEVLKIYNEIL